MLALRPMVTLPMTAAVGAMNAVGWMSVIRRGSSSCSGNRAEDHARANYWGVGGKSIWVQASTGAPSFNAGCQVTVQTKFLTARSNAGSFEGLSRMMSTVRPSADTLTQSSEARGEG